MRFLDINAMIGPYFAPRQGHFPTVEECLREMDFYGIDEAMVYNAMACEYDNHCGNHQLMDWLDGQERLHPAWVLSVSHFGMPSFEEDIREAKQKGVRLVRFFWGGLFSGLSSLNLDTLGDLFAALESSRMPVLFSNDGAATTLGDQFPQLMNVCRAFPKLPVIFAAPKIGQDFAILYKLFECCDNFHLETSSIHSNHMLEQVVHRFGVKHLVFGTGFPWFGGGQSRIALAYADLTEEEKETVASGNLRQLMEAVR